MLRYDARDRYPATTVDAFLAGADPLAPTRSPDAVYGHAVRGADGRPSWGLRQITRLVAG